MGGEKIGRKKILGIVEIMNRVMEEEIKGKIRIKNMIDDKVEDKVIEEGIGREKKIFGIKVGIKENKESVGDEKEKIEK